MLEVIGKVQDEYLKWRRSAAVLKHAWNVPGYALAIEKLFREVGLPEHLFRTLTIGSKQVEAVIEHPFVRRHLDWNFPAGRAVASKTGAMRLSSSSAAAIPISFWKTRILNWPAESVPKDVW